MQQLWERGLSALSFGTGVSYHWGLGLFHLLYLSPPYTKGKGVLSIYWLCFSAPTGKLQLRVAVTSRKEGKDLGVCVELGGLVFR